MQKIQTKKEKIEVPKMKKKVEIWKKEKNWKIMSLIFNERKKRCFFLKKYFAEIKKYPTFATRKIGNDTRS